MCWLAESDRTGVAEFLRSHPHPGGIVVSEKSRFVYMKPARTGGTSILRGALEEMSCDVFNIKNHRPRFEQWLADVTDDDLREYRIFAFVRNPWDRAVSIASYFGLELRQFVMDYEQLTAENPTLKGHAFPLHWYTHDADRRIVDFIGRFERLQHDFDRLARLLELEPCPLPRKNPSEHNDYRECYDEPLKREVGVRFARDAELYGYEFGR